jgi:hypothetical protein
MATDVPTLRATAKGIGPLRTPIVADMTVTAGEKAIAHIINKASGDLVITVVSPTTDPDGLSLKNVSITIPAQSDRFVAVLSRIADQNKLVTLTCTGDLSNASICVVDRI